MARWRREHLPDDVVEQLGLAEGERVLAFGYDPDERAVVATNEGLLLQREPPRYTRLGWREIERAGYTDGTLTVVLASTEEASGARLRIPLSEPGKVPEVVRDRVTSTVVLDQHVPLRGKLGIHVVARRLPDGEDLDWGFRVDDGLVLTEGEREYAQAAVAAVRAEYG